MMHGPARRTALMPGALTLNVLRPGASVVCAPSRRVKEASKATSLAVLPALDALPTFTDTSKTLVRKWISAGKAGLVPSKFVVVQFHARKFGGLYPVTEKLLHWL